MERVRVENHVSSQKRLRACSKTPRVPQAQECLCWFFTLGSERHGVRSLCSGDLSESEGKDAESRAPDLTRRLSEGIVIPEQCGQKGDGKLLR